MPAQWPGNVVDKRARPRIGGGFESAVAAAFTPARIINFDGLSDGQSIVGGTGVAGKKFDSVQANIAFAGGFGTIATTAEAMEGSTSSAALSIAQGSDGDPSGGSTGVGYGAFGGKIDLANGKQPGEGDKLWTGLWIKFPLGWSWDSFGTNIGFIKFLRFENDDPTSGKIDVHALNGLYNNDPAPNGEQIGWTMISEFSNKSQPDTHKKTRDIMDLGTWHWVEFYQKFSATKELTEQVIWLNETFVYSRKGADVRWIDPAGTLQTQTLTSGVLNLPTPTSKTDSFMLFTYWNGFAPQDQTTYVQKIALHTNLDGYLPNKVDAYGNVMMGAV